MKKAYRAAVLLLVACLALSFLSGCTPKGKVTREGITVTTSLEGKDAIVGSIPCTFPLTDEPVSLNILSAAYGSLSYDDVYVWQKYEQMTGVDINWTNVARDDRAQAVQTALLNGKPMDIIMRCKISASNLTKYGESGFICDLAENDLLKNYAPNCWAFLQQHPETLASITDPGGSIYSIPQVNSGAELRVSRKLFVNKQWLQNVGMELPTTTDELYELLQAFKEQDANGNGDAADEIPLCSADWAGLQEAFYGAFGLQNRGTHTGRVDCDPETGGIRFIASSDGYRKFLEYFNRLYSEGLLDSYVFSITDEQWLGSINQDRVGVFASTNLAGLPADKTDNWVAIDEALEGPDGDKLWTAIRANFHSTGAAVIPATCKNPALALRWLDYFWTDEGTLFYHMGIEGETFVVNDDGSYDYSPAIYEEMTEKNKSFDDVVAEYSPYPGGSNPTVEIAPYFRGGEMEEVPASAARALFEYGPEEYWPSFTFTGEENEAMDAMKTDIDKYCSTARQEFITGVRPLSGWDEYVSQLDKLGVDRMLAIYQTALDRYNAMK